MEFLQLESLAMDYIPGKTLPIVPYSPEEDFLCFCALPPKLHYEPALKCLVPVVVVALLKKKFKKDEG